MAATTDAASDADATAKPRPPATRPHLSRLVCAVVAVLPFLPVYVSHYLHGEGIPTGFIQGDQPYYSANGRAVFERGNGLSYPNPYDPDPAAPAIYFHWFPWLLGFGITKLHFDPGVQYVTLGVVAAVACAWLTFRLVESVLPDRRYLRTLYFLVMWGGGLLALGALAGNLSSGQSPLADLTAYDPAAGWWFLNWGRNLVYPTEATYHAIVAATWLAVLRGRWKLAVLGGAALAATHPFSGLQLLLVLGAGFASSFVVRRDRQSLYGGIAVAVLLAVVAWYYGVFLESFPQHRQLRNVWSLAWTLTPLTMLLAYGPVGAAAVARLWRDRRRLTPATDFLVWAFVVSLLLAKHDWFVAPHQPLHFTRGYVWTPLCLLALPLLQRGLVRLRETRGAAAAAAVIVVVGTVAASDNAAFVLRSWRNPYAGSPLYMSPGERNMFEWVDAKRLRGVLATPYPNTSYLAATYTPLRPYYGHPYNTPNYAARVAQVESWLTTGKAELSPPADYVLLERGHVQKFVNRSAWEPAYENAEFVLLRRR
jgi:hypothetical protein